MQLHARPHRCTDLLEEPSSSTVDVITSDAGDNGSSSERLVDLSIVEGKKLDALHRITHVHDRLLLSGETGTQYHIKRVRLATAQVRNPVTETTQTHVQLIGDHCQFATEDLLIGMRAALECQQWLNSAMSEEAEYRPLHVGKMTISLQVSYIDV